MAVTMVIGNSPAISASLLALGYTIPAVLANEFGKRWMICTLSLNVFGLDFVCRYTAG